MNQILEFLISNSSLAVSESMYSLSQNVTNLTKDVDPNWFYSTSAQCAAAIVGLIGAFLITKLINQKAYLSQIKKEIKENRINIESINEEIKTKKEYIQNIDDRELVDEFLSHIMNEINPDVPPDLDSIYNLAQKHEKYININKEILKNEYNEEYFIKLVNHLEESIDEFLKYLDNSKLLDIHKLDEDEIFEELKKKFTGTKNESIIRSESVFKERYKEFKRNRGFDGIYGLGNLITSPEMENKAVSIKYEQYKDDIATKKAELSLYENILKHQMSLLSANLDIPSMKRNLFLLCLFSLIGLFLPLFMMLFDNGTMIKLRVPIFLLILFGWSLVIANLINEFFQLIFSLSDIND